ncbi:hypothetical protein EJB05_29571 [Eragrostis curvula]|uniref:Uncharacterized protein n=1 Tax=Eragrostis curvula TaxID=38414 RepID=A0A5J9UTC9_9POAL|nr:hypothetical protein EJB05_29571 [Eragrostis curvula]
MLRRCLKSLRRTWIDVLEEGAVVVWPFGGPSEAPIHLQRAPLPAAAAAARRRHDGGEADGSTG